MVFFNHATRQMTAKIVYYGPGLCGKTTNLNTIYGKTSQKARGEMVSLNTETDRTLFFDLLPMDVGVVGGFKCKLQLYTVPGQVFYNSTRKLVLKGVDGIVFVADSQTPMLDANKESLQNLQDNLRELGLELSQIPMVFQWNKRDLKNIVPVDQLEAELNARRAPSFQSIASDGTGVFETLRGITKLALGTIKANHFADTGTREAEMAPPPPPAPVQHHPSTPTPAAPLSLSDLPSVGDLLEDDGFAAPAPHPRAAPLHPADLLPPSLASDELPDLPEDDEAPDLAPLPVEPVAISLPAPAPPAPMVSPRAPLPRPSAPQAKAVALPRAPLAAPRVSLPAPPQPKAAASPRPLMGGLVAPLAPATAAGLRVLLPADLGAGDLEVIVQVRQGDQVVGEARVKKPTPGKGGLTRITLELKRG